MWLAATPDVGGQRFCIKCIFQIIFNDSTCSPLHDVLCCVVSWSLGWAYRVISQPSLTKIPHLCSHRNSLISLKVPLGWEAAAGPFDRYVPPLNVYWKWRFFSSTLWGSHVQREGHCWAGSVPACIHKQQLEYYTFSPGVSSWHGYGFSADGKPFISSKHN